MTIAEIHKSRVAAGTCRHCGGKIPCYSQFGDREVGKRHTTKSLREYRERLATIPAIPPETPGGNGLPSEATGRKLESPAKEIP